MIKIFSIKEIIQASTDILNSQNQKKLNTKKIIGDKEKIMPKFKNKFKINEKVSIKKTLVLDEEINNAEEIPPNLNKIISQAEKNQFKILDTKSKKTKNENNSKIIDELYKLFNKKIKKNTLKLIVELRNNIVSLDKRILSLKEKEQKINLKLDLSENQNGRLADINNDLIQDINQLKTKINDHQNNLDQLENDKSDLELKLKGYQNQNIKLDNENRNLKLNNNELKIKVNKLQDQLEYFEKNNSELNIKLEKNINQNNFYKQNNKELNLKLNELSELKTYKYKYLEYKQKNSDLENMLAKIKLDEDKNLQNSNFIKELENKIKFYQGENIRVGTELLETQKRSEILKDEVKKYENQRSNLISQINSVNDVIKDSNILTNVFENKIEPRINVIDPQNIQKKSEPDLNEKVKAIFSKKI